MSGCRRISEKEKERERERERERRGEQVLEMRVADLVRVTESLDSDLERETTTTGI